MIVRVPIDHVPTTARVIDVADLSEGKLQIAAVGAPLPIQLLRREVRVSIVCRRTRGALYRLFFIGPRRLGYSPRPQWLVRVVNLRTVDGDCRPDRRGRLDSRIRRRYCLGRLRCRRLPGVIRTLNGGPERKTRNAHDDGADARLHSFLFSPTSLAWFPSPMGFGRTIGHHSLRRASSRHYRFDRQIPMDSTRSPQSPPQAGGN